MRPCSLRSWLPLAFGACAALLPAPAAAQSEALELRIDLSRPMRPTEESQTLVAVLKNRSGEAQQILLPLHRPMVPFPSWELVDARGAIVRPQTPPFQSSWKDGLQGEILKLAPGAEVRFSSSVRLSAGIWTARCKLERTNDEVSWSEEAFKTVKRRLPGLWIGETEAEPVRFVVGARVQPALQVKLPKRAPVGGAYPVTVSLLPGSASHPRGFRAAFELVAGSKAYGSGGARLVWRDNKLEPALPGEFQYVDLARLSNGESLTVDMGRLSFERDRGASPLGLYDFVPQGVFRVSMKLFTEEGETWVTGGGEGRIAPVEDVSSSGLKLHVKETDRHRVVDVVLRNEGKQPLRVPAVLLYPRHITFGLRPVLEGQPRPIVSITKSAGNPGLLMDPDEPTRGAVLPRTLSWDGDLFERARTYEQGGTVVLAPGGELRRRFDLNALVVGPRSAMEDPLRLNAIWRNRESGWRLGLDEPMVVGRLESAPMELPPLRK